MWRGLRLGQAQAMFAYNIQTYVQHLVERFFNWLVFYLTKYYLKN